MNPQVLVNGVGVVAALFSMASFVPQLIKVLRERDASGVSLRMYVITVTGFSLWAAYGVLLKSWPLVASNLVSLALSAFILISKLWLDRHEQPATGPVSSPARSGLRR